MRYRSLQWKYRLVFVGLIVLLGAGAATGLQTREDERLKISFSGYERTNGVCHGIVKLEPRGWSRVRYFGHPGLAPYLLELSTGEGWRRGMSPGLCGTGADWQEVPAEGMQLKVPIYESALKHSWRIRLRYGTSGWRDRLPAKAQDVLLRFFGADEPVQTWSEAIPFNPTEADIVAACEREWEERRFLKGMY